MPKKSYRFQNTLFAFLLLAISHGAVLPSHAQIAITEIMYHPASQSPDEEYVEILNTSNEPVRLYKWRFDRGIDFQFPKATLGAGQYLIVAANPTSFTARYNSGPAQVLGPWTGRLSNSGEQLRLENDNGDNIDSIHFSDEGDWSFRQRGPNDLGHTGWVWSDLHDGGGRSLELINLAAPPDIGQNWAASLVAGGTPGAPNSIAADNTAPFIQNVSHAPAIPRSADPVVVTATVLDDRPGTPTVTLYHRLDGLASFTSTTMTGGPTFSAEIPAYPNGSVIEFYIRAIDADGASRTYPPPTQPSGQQLTNLLYVVDDIPGESTAILPRGSNWRYLDDGSVPTPDWPTDAFNDSAWPSGPAELGYGDGDETTVLSYGTDPNNKPITTYFRTTFQVDDLTNYSGLLLRLQRDDGAVVYINGDEIHRDNMPQGPVTSRTLALSMAGQDTENVFFETPIPVSSLQTGQNLLAVEIHKASANNPDIGFDLEIAGVSSSSSAVIRWRPGDQPIYHLVMTRSERNEITAIGDTDGGDRNSDAQMNATFITIDEDGTKTRYNAGVRNRGHGSRSRPPMNYHVNIPHDHSWRGVTAININSQYPWVQVIGEHIFSLAGNHPGHAQAIQVRLNGQDQALSTRRMFGSYAAIEVLNGDYAANHFPDDPNGNVYKCFRTDTGTYTEAELQYLGEDPTPYRRIYFKQTNETEDDWTDIIGLCDTLNNAPNAGYRQAVSQVLDLDQWLHYLALDALLLNRETGLNRGIGDDYAMYRGVEDPRFLLVPHDLDTVMQQGSDTGSLNQTIFNHRGVKGLDRLTIHPDIVGDYYRAFFDHFNFAFNPEVLNPLIDETLGDFVPASAIQSTKNFVVNRTNVVLAEIPTEFIIQTDLTVVGGYPRATIPVAALHGTAHAAYTRSVTVDGLLADYSPVDGVWTLGESHDVTFQTLVPEGALWRYLDDGSNAGTAWRETEFNDAAWKAGNAELGYGDGDETTVVGYGPDSNNKYITTYFRHSFQIDDITNATALNIRLLRDDGAAIYLNGHKIISSNVPDEELTAQTFALSSGTNDEGTFLEYTTGTAPLRQGQNVLAVEIHQHSLDSSDISFDIDLQIEFATTGQTTGVDLLPGINRVYVKTHDAPGGAGNVLETGHIDIWYDPPAEGGPKPPDPTTKTQHLEIQTRDSYLPGVPFLVRAWILDENGDTDRDLWDAKVTLSADQPGVALSNTLITIRNGYGSALVAADATPGTPFTLWAHFGDLAASRTLASLSAATPLEVSGALSGLSTTWSGLVHVTGDTLVPVNHTLTIEPGALVLLDGNPTLDSENGADINVQGTIHSLGTPERPVTFTAFDPNAPWGEIHHDNAAPSLYQYTNITRAGHAPQGGHTDTGPAIRSVGSVIEFDHVAITDIAGKAMQITDPNLNGSDLVFRHSEFARCAMGPEMVNSAFRFVDGWITDMLGVYRDDGIVNDNDGIYFHDQAAGQEIALIRSVLANTQDDGIDTLGADISLDGMIIRNVFDKGVSVNGGETSVTRTLIAHCDIGISSKNSSAVTNLDHTTIANCANGLVLESSAGETHVHNSIVRGAVDSVNADPADDMHITYSNLGEPWPGEGNTADDPQFVYPVGNNYYLAANSPAIDTGAPASPPDPDGSRADMGYAPYRGDKATEPTDPPYTEIPGGDLTADTLLTAAAGPWRVTGDLVVPVGVTLTIAPGATLFFDAGTQITVRGRLLAEGLPGALIRFTWYPGQAAWDGIQFNNATIENRIVHAIIEHAQTNNGSIGLDGSNLVLENSTIDHTVRRRIRTQNSSLLARGCVFTDIYLPGQAPSTDNGNEQIWGAEILTGGRFILDNNYFGSTTGHNDLVDFDCKRPGSPMPQILNNYFAGSGDDALDLEGDAYIEGNTFANVYKDQFNVDPGQSNVISAGDGHQFIVVRNIFRNIGHVSLIKENSFMTFVNNTVDNASVPALYFDLAGQTSGPGRGAVIDGNIFHDTPTLLSDITTQTVAIHRSIVPVADIGLGQGNLSADPRLADPTRGDYTLLPDSPAIGAGPNGLDMGALVPAGASISGEPSALTDQTSVTLQIGGPGVLQYRYSLNSAPYGNETSVAEPIRLTGLPLGDITIAVLGKNAAGVWQTVPATRQWTIIEAVTLDALRVTEIMYDPHAPNGSDFEFIEFQNTGLLPLDLSGASLSEAITYTFPNPTLLQPGEFHVLACDLEAFATRHGAGVASDTYDGKLANEGEFITLLDSHGAQVLRFQYGSSGSWPERANGNGSSLELKDPANATPLSLSNPDSWRSSVEYEGSPGRAGLGPIRSILINEVLTHTDPPQTDTIELVNAASQTIDIGGWRLSDSKNNYFKFRIPFDIPLEPGAAITFDETDFNPTLGYDPNDFSLSGAYGDAVHLLSDDGQGNFLFIDDIDFGAAANGEPFGRWPDATPKLGQTTPEGLVAGLYPMTAHTPKAPNSGPRFGPLVINEIQYHPQTAQEEFRLEFVEIFNSSAQTVQLADWRVRKGIDYDFAPNAAIASGSVLVLVAFNPANAPLANAFRSAYGIDGTVALAGPYIGALDNGGDALELQRPDAPPLDDPLFIPRLVEDRVDYDDIAPWPTAPDGQGQSLTRLSAASFGNDTHSWIAASPTPGHIASTALQAPRFESAPTTAGLLGILYEYKINASGIPTPVVAVEALPSWLVFDAARNILSGVPRATGQTPTITVTATNSQGMETQTFSIAVTQPSREPMPATLILY